MWPSKYEDALSEWYILRQTATNLKNLEDSLHLINNWWAKAPMVNNLLHFADYEDWPGPWDLLTFSGYCTVATSMGICYTLLLLEHKDINRIQIVQTNISTVIHINDGQYILNDERGDIMPSNDIQEILYSIDCEYFKNKIK